MNCDVAKLTASVQAHESYRAFVYDDATGAPIRPGSLIKGHPTIAWGRALDTSGVSQLEGNLLLSNGIVVAMSEVNEAFSWIAGLDDVRTRVLVEMAYQMGIAGLLEFHDTLRCVQTGQWSAAAHGMLDSEWAKQTPTRAEALAQMMRTGQDPG